MVVNTRVLIVVSAVVFAGGFALGGVVSPWGVVEAQSSKRVFELRTYTAPEGKLGELQARFKNHTVRIFEKHGMTNVGYFVPQDAPDPQKPDTPNSQNTLIYVLAHKDRATAAQSWAAFGKDPDWVKARTESEANGRLTTRVVSVFMDPTDFSQMK